MPFLRVLRSTDPSTGCPRLFPNCAYNHQGPGPVIDVTSATGSRLDSASYSPTSQLGMAKAAEAEDNKTVRILGIIFIVSLLLVLAFMWVYFTKTVRYAIINWVRRMRGKEPIERRNGRVIGQPVLISTTSQLVPGHVVPSLSYASTTQGTEAISSIRLPSRAVARPPRVMRYSPPPLSKLGNSTESSTTEVPLSRQESKVSCNSTKEPEREDASTSRPQTPEVRLEDLVAQALAYQESKPAA